MSNFEEDSPIDSKIFSSFFDEDFRLVKEHEFRKAVFKNGITEELKDVVWKYLFQFYPFNSTPRERAMKNKEKFIEYFLMRAKWNQICDTINENTNSNQNDLDSIVIPMLPFNIEIKPDTNKNEYCIEDPNVNVDYIKIQTILHISRINISNTKLMNDIRQIEKDLERTGYLIDLDEDNSDHDATVFTKEHMKAFNSLRNILVTFCAFNQSIDDFNTVNKINLGYTQGMNELASIFMSIFEQESVAYWCFSNFMLLDSYSTSCIPVAQINQTHVLKINVAHYFSDVGMSKKMDHLSFLLHQIDPVLYSLFEKFELEGCLFCHEWLLLYFKRCFKTKEQYQRCFEIIGSHFVELNKSIIFNVSVKDLYSFDLFVCLALLKYNRQDFLDKCESETDIFEVFKMIKEKDVFAHNFNQIFKIAEEIFESYCSNFAILNQNINKRMSLTPKQPFSKRLEKLKEFLFD